MSNELAGETSPYLLQHAENPVHWVPWSPEALARAAREDCPVLLSIGYSACHWCHVMEQESFSDPEVADLMNRGFVNVKVDREERPDVDAIYMRAVQALTGRGGWPLTVFLTPAGKPFYGGTYFPPEPRHGMPSFRQVLEATLAAWHDRRDAVEGAAGEITQLLERANHRTAVGPEEDTPPFDRALLSRAAGVVLARFDRRTGGFGGAPRFPQPMLLEFLLGQHVRTRGIRVETHTEEEPGPSGEIDPLHAALQTLRAMARGGLRDHLAGGFHRYAVDAEWRVPHFEKMLYDNALLAGAYLRAFQVTGDEEMRDVAVETLEYLLADLRSPDGAFYAARDADSEGEEGRYYVWTLEEIEEVLGADDAALFARSHGVTREGNWEGRNILIPAHGPTALAREAALPVEEFRERIARCRELLLARRATREPPIRDSKILAGWNGLALRTLAEAGAALDEPRFVHSARSGMEYLLDALRPTDDRLLHQVPGGTGRRIPAFLDDLAALGNACVSLHEVTLERRWLEEAIRLAGEIEAWFRDPETELLFDTPSDGEALVVRPRSPLDTPTPSGPSLSAELFLRLGTMMGSSALLRASHNLVEPLTGGLTSMPDAFGHLLGVADAHLHPPIEIALVPGDRDRSDGRGNGTGPTNGDPGDLGALLRETHRHYLPGRVISGIHPSEPGAPPSPLLEGRSGVAGRAAAYVCRHHACRQPVTTAPELRAALEEAAAP